jgi:hypothetical protein
VGGALIAGSGPQVKAATIGDVLKNSQMTVGTDSNGVRAVTYNGKPWSMYEIPGLGRERTPSEGSFVETGYSWAGGTQLSTAATNSAITSGWNNGQTASPIAVSFKDTGSGNGKAYFSLNYVDKDDLVDFGNGDNAPAITQAWANQQLTAAQKNQIYNPNNGVSSKMKSDSPTGTPTLDSNNASFDGGYMQATGNVPISAAVAQSSTLADATMAGDWAVMVRVQVANGIDAKALAASVDWDKSYYYLTINTISVIGTKFTVNFPLQFDHHVYLDPNSNQDFFLKVKGIPFWAKQTGNAGSGWYGIFPPVYHTYVAPDDPNSTVQLQLQDGNADYVDYLNNRQITGGTNGNGTAKTLDRLDGPDGDKTQQTAMDDSRLVTKVNGQTQPNFSVYKHQSVSSILDFGAPLWNLYGVMNSDSDDTTKGPLYNAGPTGRMIVLLSGSAGSGNQTSERLIGTGLSGVYASAVNWFTTNKLTGNAHINFSFDMSKYAAGTSQKEQALTAGRFFAAPKADGTFNQANETGQVSSDAIKITMFDSSQLVDPYNLIPSDTANYSRTDTSTTSNIRKILRTDKSSQMNATSAGQAGMTPADYAVIDKKYLDQGTEYPTYTNFTSWTGAIMPYDRMHWTDDSKNTEDTSFTDTMHSANQLQKTGTASPDPAQDGILVNGTTDPFQITERTPFLDTQTNLQPTFTDEGKTKLGVAGAIYPQRYANVYQFYDYNSDGTATEDIKPIYSNSTNNLKVGVAANAPSNGKSAINLKLESWKSR